MAGSAVVGRDVSGHKIDPWSALRYGSAPMRARRVAVVASVALLLAACQHEQKTEKAATPPATAAAPGGSDTADASEVVATYAGKKLTSAHVLEEIERLPGPSRTYLSQPDRKRQFVENLILNDLLFTEAEKQGYANDPDIERQVQDMRKRLVVQRLMRDYQKPPEITDEQAKQYYDDNPNLYSTTQIRASHILVRDEDTAKAIRGELEKDPSKFAEIAKAQSIDKTSGAKGGDLGKFGQGRMVPDFERVAFSLKVGEISQPVKTQYGWHIITVTERDEGQRRPFEQVKEQIKATLRNKALQDNVQGRFEALKKAANVQIDDAELAKINPPPATPAQMPAGAMGGH
jgi:peptidyl-prolyl cis-trans isomerase C